MKAIVLTEHEFNDIVSKREAKRQQEEIQELWNALNKKMIEYNWHWNVHLPDNKYWPYGSHRVGSVNVSDNKVTLNVRR